MPNTITINKKSLSEENLEKLFDIKQFRQMVLDNIQYALNGKFTQDSEEGILSLPDFEKKFDFSGSIKTHNDPTRAEDASAHFFSVDGRCEKIGEKYHLRGARYVVSLDSNLEVRQKLNILRNDFLDGLSAISEDEEIRGMSEDKFLRYCAIIDYVKNSATTLLNALIYREKIGDFKISDEEYQRTRSMAIELAYHATKLFYSFLIGRQKDYEESFKKISCTKENIDALIGHLKNQYVFRIFSSRSFVRPEASHPLVVVSASYNIAHKMPNVDTIVGMPAGGTELAFVLQYAYELIGERKPHLILLPLSVHSIKSFTDSEEVSLEEASNYLSANAQIIHDKRVVIVDDNSSTGQTLQKATELILGEVRPRDLKVAVAEIDIIRTILDKDNPNRAYAANPAVYQYATNILPVSKHLKPKHDLKELSEQNKLLAYYREGLNRATTTTERIKYELYIKNTTEPTMGKLEQLNEENAILSFHQTFLSNFYATPIVLNEVTYPSVEHAYQAQKFSLGALSGITKEQLDYLNELLRLRGSAYTIKKIEDIFSDPAMTSGNIKIITGALREMGCIRNDWDDIKLGLMIDLLKQKFSDPVLAKKLKDTQPKYLVEGNTWADTFWGISDGRGRNFLGQALMYMRDNL